MEHLTETERLLIEDARSDKGYDVIRERKPGDGEVALEPDGYILPESKAKEHYHPLLGQAVEQHLGGKVYRRTHKMKLGDTDAGKEIAALKASGAAAVLRSALLRAIRLDAIYFSMVREKERKEGYDMRFSTKMDRVSNQRSAMSDVVEALLKRKLPLLDDDLVVLGRWFCMCEQYGFHTLDYAPIGSAVKALDRVKEAGGLSCVP